jgi:hypothetical protein
MLTQAHRFLYIPLDARPVCLQATHQLAKLLGVELLTPPLHVLGELKTPAHLELLMEWLKNTLHQHGTTLQAAIIAMDTPLYGGLITSRLGHETIEALEHRKAEVFEALKGIPLYGFASVMRIPNYNNDEEEPEYWAIYGERLHQLSAALHKAECATTFADKANAMEAASGLDSLPEEVVQDFLNRRSRNHHMARTLLEDVVAGRLNYLVYCEDDRGMYGLNVQEAETLNRAITEKKLTDVAHVQTGADEVAHTLLLKAWCDVQGNTPLRIHTQCAQNLEAHARFDGVPIYQAYQQRLAALRAQPTETLAEADLCVVIHAPHQNMGDHCEGILSDTTPEDAEATLHLIQTAHSKGTPVALLDVAYANGGDPHLLDTLLQRPESLEKLAAYSAWNTPGNAMGCGLAFGLAASLGRSEETERYRKQALLTRLLDDGVYQPIVRKQWREQSLPLELPALTQAICNGLPTAVWQAMGVQPSAVQASFPCNRTFECGIEL